MLTMRYLLQTLFNGLDTVRNVIGANVSQKWLSTILSITKRAPAKIQVVLYFKSILLLHNVLAKVATNVCTCSWLPESSIPRQGSMWPQPRTGIGKQTVVPRVTRWAEVCSLRQRLLPLTRIWDRHRRIRTWHRIRHVENATNGWSHTRRVCHLPRVPGLVNDSIIFCLLFTIKDRCKKVHFQQTYNQGFRQLLLTVSGHH